VTRTKIIDTSALMVDPSVAIPGDGEAILIPSLVIRELDALKENKQKSSRARAAIRILTPLLEQRKISVSLHKERCGEADDQIIEIGMFAKVYNPVIVTNDLTVQIFAMANSIPFEEVKPVFPDVAEVMLSSDQIDTIYKTGRCEFSGDFKPNDCLLIRSESNPSQTVLGLMSRDGQFIYRVMPRKPWDVAPRSMRQHFLAWLLTDPEIKILTVAGAAGTGKTLMACAAACDQVFEKHTYDNIFVTRPFVPVGEGLGFLPGELDEKMAPWMKAVESLIHDLIGKGADHMMHYVHRFPLSYARGMTVSDGYWIIDEAQNFSKDELKALLTRVGDNCKAILTGDLSQSDRGSQSSGMQSVISAYHGEKFYAHITLDKIQRGDVCRIASERM
jgi:PhoH-like ATPase